MVNEVKERVRQHWEAETAGIRYGEGVEPEGFYRSIEQQRYLLEPYIPSFAQFELYSGKRVLEIGVGGGTDFCRFVRHGACATGVELTAAGIDHTRRHLQALHYQQKSTALLVQADAENLPFRDNTFDLAYSWGVVHHTPDSMRALSEAFRVLKPGASLKAMIYHMPSWTCWMLWLRYALLAGRPLVAPRRCAYENLESPGTKVYSVAEAKQMLSDLKFTNIWISTKLGPSDLLAIKASHRYRGLAYRLAWGLYPRWLVRLLGDRFGLYMLLLAQKPP